MTLIARAAAALLAAATLGAAAAATPCHLEAVLGVSHGSYTAAELLTLRGAVEEGAVGVIAAITDGDADDLRALVALAASDGQGPIRTASLSD